MTSHRDEESICLVEDAATSMRNLKKDDDAVWVQGLQPEPDGETIAAMELINRRRREAAAAAAGSRGIDDPVRLKAPDRHWLRTPLIFGTMLLLALVGRLALMPHETTAGLEYAAKEVDTWPTIRAYSYWVLVTPMALVTLLGAASSITLCIQFGAASQRFMPFLGVGMSLLAILALIADGILLLNACPPEQSYCDLPFVSHWICHVFRNSMIPLSFWTCSFVLDEVRANPTLKYVWSIILALPVVSHAGFVADAAKSGAPNQLFLLVSDMVQITVLVLLLWKIYSQRQFGVVVPKEHDN